MGSNVEPVYCYTSLYITHSKTSNTMANLINVFIVSMMIYTVSSLKCYNCGYRIIDGGEAQSMPDLAYCNDFATPEDIVTDCTAPGDCCASMKEEIDRLDGNGNKNYTELIARHGCGSEIGDIEGTHHTCDEHPNSCFNVDDATFPSENKTAVITNIEVCFCSIDRCNEEDPIFPEPTTTTAPGGGASSTVASIVLVTLGALLIEA